MKTCVIRTLFLIAMATGLVNGCSESTQPSSSTSGNYRIAFAENAGLQEGVLKVSVMNEDGSGYVVLNDTTRPSLVFTPCPSWSPDGAYIAYPADGDLVIVNVSSGARVLAKGREQGFEAARSRVTWSPSRNHVVAVSRSLPPHVVIFDQGGDVVSTATFDESVDNALWSPQGDKIAVAGDQTLFILDTRLQILKSFDLESIDVYSHNFLGWNNSGTELIGYRIQYPEEIYHVVAVNVQTGVHRTIHSFDHYGEGITLRGVNSKFNALLLTGMEPARFIEWRDLASGALVRRTTTSVLIADVDLRQDGKSYVYMGLLYDDYKALVIGTINVDGSAEHRLRQRDLWCPKWSPIAYP